MDNQFNEVEKLAQLKPATSLETPKSKETDIDYFIKCVEESITSDLKKYFDTGYNYFKISGTDSLSFIKTFFYLFSDYFKTILKESNIDLDKQEVIKENLNLILKNNETMFLVFDNFLESLKVPKNIFDSNKLSMIITGYAINSIKKNFRSKT